MARFAGGSTAQATEGSRSAAANERCNSRSDAMPFLQDAPRAMALGHQFGERRNVVVPLDQRGLWAEARDRLAVQLPDFFADLRTMVVDQHAGLARMAGHMDLAHARGRQARDV